MLRDVNGTGARTARQVSALVHKCNSATLKFAPSAAEESPKTAGTAPPASCNDESPGTTMSTTLTRCDTKAAPNSNPKAGA
eukprot:gene28759-10630_t